MGIPLKKRYYNNCGKISIYYYVLSMYNHSRWNMNNNMRKEMRIDLLLIAVFLMLRTFTNTPSSILAFIFAIQITLMLIGGIKEKSYQRLKAWEKSF